MQVHVDHHPLLELAAFRCEFPAPLGELESEPGLVALLDLDAEAPLERSEQVRGDVRKLLRAGGYRPTGRGKPASEYLVRAAGEGQLGSINLAVDACNAASLHSGLPISVVDAQLAEAPLSVRVMGRDAAYVFNASGQEIGLEGLLCLCDAQGPCANAVKDAQRTKTHAETRSTVVVVWGTTAHPGRAQATAAWQRRLFEAVGVATSDVEVMPAAG